MRHLINVGTTFAFGLLVTGLVASVVESVRVPRVPTATHASSGKMQATEAMADRLSR
jgi:hypothetical protein